MRVSIFVFTLILLLPGTWLSAATDNVRSWDDSTLADRALILIGAEVPGSSKKCAGCHQLNPALIREWAQTSLRVDNECLTPWRATPSSATAEAALRCFSNDRFQWRARFLGFHAARVESGGFDQVFADHFGEETAGKLQRFQRQTYMPRSGTGGFSDEDWNILSEWMRRGLPMLDDKLGARPAAIPAGPVDQVVIDDLESPWAVVTSPNGEIWITEQDGQIKIYNGDFHLQRTLKNLPDLRARGQGGLLDLAFHPRFAENGWVYVAYSVDRAGHMFTRINRFTYRDGAFREHKVILNGPEGDDSAHFGCRLLFDDAGYLYASFGERHHKELAQDVNTLHGKVVRVTDEGAIPSDNPFGPQNPIFTMGHRNPQGLALHPVSREIYDSEHGPTGYDAPGGGDEINRLVAGGNYGWPVIHHELTKKGMISPLREYTPAIAPSGMAFYTGGLIPEWANDLFIANLGGESLLRLRIGANGQVMDEEVLFEGKYGRLRDVGVGPDGSLLIVSDYGELIQVTNK